MRSSNRSRAVRPSRNYLEWLEDRTLLSSAPSGAVDTFTRTTIAGYAFNKDDGQLPMTIDITVNGSMTTLIANNFRDDLIKKVGSPYHAFSFTLPTLPAGISKIVVQAVSPVTGAIKTLRSGTITNPVPKGKVEVVSATEIIGYAYDTDTTGPLQVRIDVDGVAGTPFATDIARPDLKIGSQYVTPGFDVTGDFAGHVVEVYALDSPTGTPVLLYTNNHKPIGKVEVNDGFTVSGWALDPDNSAASITVRVTIDGTVLTGSPFSANLERDDLVAKYNSSMHGFSIAIPALTPGMHTIAVYAIDGQAGSAAPVFIGSARVNNNAPTGHLDAATTQGVLTGWALDKDLGSSPATVNLYVDDQFFGTTSAALTRTDAGRPNHGFSFDISTLGTTSHAITLTVIDNRSPDNEVVFYDGFINNHQPTGAFNPIVNDTLTGWAFDQDAPDFADPVDVYIDGVYTTTITANQPSVGEDLVLNSSNHGFSMALPALGFGTHKIQLYAAESQQNVSVLIGTQTVKIARPIGVLESATSTTLTGYAIDPNHVGQSVQIEVFINGVLDDSLTTTANVTRADLMTKSPFKTDPGYSDYGFSITLPALDAGRNQIDVYAVDPNNGLLSPIASRAITI